jgi:TRAP-type C4-dicarboxylate transport system permease small subunit
METVSLILSGVCCALLATLSLLDVFFRTLDVKFFIATDTGGFLMGWLIFFALPAVTRSRDHIKVDFLIRMLGEQRRVWFVVFGNTATLVYMGVLIWLCGTLAYDAWADQIRAQGILRIPTFYPFAGIVFGFALAFISQAMALAELMRDGRK